MCTARALVLVSLACAACRGTPRTPDSQPLPFHVALIPIQSCLIREPTAEPEGATSMRLEPDLERFNRTLRDALAARAFTRVTLLEPPHEEPGSPLAPEERDRRWIESAQASKADLVLECELDLVPIVCQEANASFWLDFPLFLLGGPVVWFVKDRTYTVDVELRGTFYDRWALDGEWIRLGDRRARLLETSAAFEGVDLNFLQRADGAGQYFLSVLVPSGFLAKESESLAAELDAVVADRLSGGLASSVLRKGDELLRSDQTAPFHLAIEETTLAFDEDRLVLEGTVFLRSDARVEMSRWRVHTGAGTFEGDFESARAAPRGERWLAWRFEQVLPIEASDSTVVVELQAGSRDPIPRSYTLAIPGRAPVPELAAGR